MFTYILEIRTTANSGIWLDVDGMFGSGNVTNGCSVWSPLIVPLPFWLLVVVLLLLLLVGLVGLAVPNKTGVLPLVKEVVVGGGGGCGDIIFR